MSQKTPKKPKKVEKYITERIKIEKLIPGGQALGTLANGKKLMLWGALPGEIVSKVRVTKEKSSFIEGIATEITEKSPNRVIPKDERYLSTSPWQIMTADYENTQKAVILREVFRQHNVQIPSAFQDFQVKGDGNYYHYRNKMEYALYYSHEDAQIHLAFHERGSHRKLPITRSNLERPEIWAEAQAIVAELNRRGEDARKYQNLLLRCNQNGKVSGGLYENYQPHRQFDSLSDEILGKTYTYSPNGFFQINLPVYQMVLGEIQKWVKTDRVLDLYAGVGTIGLSVAPNKNLTLVECDQAAYRELETNAKVAKTSTGNAQIMPVLAKSEDALRYIAPDQTVIVDPPRAGCLPAVIERLLEATPERIAYLSCNPATQARDVKKLLTKYQISYFQPYNFFPRTPHIENLIILERQ